MGPTSGSAGQRPRKPQLLPGCRSSLSPCATPLVPCHLSISNPLALLGAVCPRAFVAAIAPVGIIFSFLLSDTGCGHNKTLGTAGRGAGSPHVGSARSGQWHVLTAAQSCAGEGSSCVPNVQTHFGSPGDRAGAEELTLPASSILQTAPMGAASLSAP